MEQGSERPRAEEPPFDEAEQEAQEEAQAVEADGLEGLSEEELRARVREAREEAQRNWKHFLHSAADLENYKKQAARTRQDAVDKTRRQMLGLVLSVLDNLERALMFGAEDGRDKALLDGLRMTHRQILSQLAGVGVKPIEAVGRRFDPRLHEAVGVVPAQSPNQASGTVAGEVLKGYLFNDDVLRPAKVTVVR